MLTQHPPNQMTFRYQRNLYWLDTSGISIVDYIFFFNLNLCVLKLLWILNAVLLQAQEPRKDLLLFVVAKSINSLAPCKSLSIKCSPIWQSWVKNRAKFREKKRKSRNSFSNAKSNRHVLCPFHVPGELCKCELGRAQRLSKVTQF